MRWIIVALVGAGLVTALSLSGFVCCDQEVLADEARQAKDFTLRDPSGTEHTLSTHRGSYIVLEWINFGCPFVRKHYDGGNMQGLQQALVSEGVVWYAVCSSAPGTQGYFEGQALIDKVAAENFSGTAYLVDAEGEVGRAYGAKTTPHMFVIDPEGNIIFEGAIDSIRSQDSADCAKATNYVKSAIAAHKAGEKVDPAFAAPYGCSVKYKKK